MTAAVVFGLLFVVACTAASSETSNNAKPTIRATVEATNMPALMQLDAADALRAAYELHSSDYGRMELMTEIFAEKYPQYLWNAVVDYQHLYFIADLFIRIRPEEDEAIFMFSTRPVFKSQ